MKIPQPSKTLLNLVRAGFMLQDTSIFAWCKKNNLQYQNVKAYLMGEYNGKKAQEIRERVICDSVHAFGRLK